MRRLPVLLERSIASVKVLQTSGEQDFNQQVLAATTEAKKPITCTKGCASCCYHPVMISILEGILIYRWLERKGKFTDELKRKLKSISDQQFGTSYEVWLFSLTPCPLLTSDNLCSAYEVRPFNCRIYYAVSDPHYCHPHRLGTGTEIINRTEALEGFQSKLEALLKEHEVSFRLMPIGAAVLYGAEICAGKLDLGALDRALFGEMIERA